MVVENPPQVYVDPTNDNAAVWLRNQFDGVAEQLSDRVVTRYAGVRHAEVARDHTLDVHRYMFLHYLNAADPRLADFLQNGDFSVLPVPNLDPLPRPAG